jgi:tRNA modification GTPase
MAAKKKNADSDGGTIVAVITPPGTGGIAALRIAGRCCLSYLERHFRPISPEHTKPKPFVMRYGHFVDGKGSVIDEITAVYMPRGKSYTGMDQVEIYCHGGNQVVKLIQDEIVLSGARVAEPGEFTKLAFLSGRIDLIRAEAVAEVIAANTDTSFRAARDHLLGTYYGHVNGIRESLIDIIAEVEASVDYPEEDTGAGERHRMIAHVDVIMKSIKDLIDTYQGGQIINEGFKIVVGGRPNAGKSSLFNLLLRQERALVTPTPGTTRDYLSEWIELGGFKVNIIDTAGLRATGGVVERAGQKSARRIIGQAHLLLWMVDLSRKSWQRMFEEDMGDLAGTLMILLGNKIDLVANADRLVTTLRQQEIIPVSCKTGKGIAGLKESLTSIISDKMPDLTSGVVVTSARHRQKLASSLRSLKAARAKIRSNETPELTAFDLRQAVAGIDEITGKVYSEEILGRIFSKFCIGK